MYNTFKMMLLSLLIIFSSIFLLNQIIEPNTSIYYALAITLLNTIILCIYHLVILKKRESFYDSLRIKNKILNITLKLNNSFIKNEENNIYQVILDNAIDLIDKCNYGSLLIYNPDDYMFSFKAVKGYDFDFYKSVKIHLNESFIYRQSDNEFNSPVIIKNIYEHNKKFLSPEDAKLIYENTPNTIKETISLPIKLNDEIYGFINIDSTSSFTQQEIKILDYYIKTTVNSINDNNLIKKTIRLSKYDKLTNIYTRSYFEETFELYSKNSIRYNTKYSFVLIDINYLKAINDNFGHSIGDKALRYFTDTVKTQIRETDLFARLGGDEFVIVFHESSFQESNNKMKEILNKFLDTEFTFTNENSITSFNISFSYGIAVAPDESMIFDVLLRLADDKMYKFKKNFKKNNPNAIPYKSKI
ncbi:MAG: sensor domain-containing diguanylate cyclase [Bacillota bacterium]|nr:sensor domain-containing diguanylate cyclase [Bacillota bacterium]